MIEDNLPLIIGCIIGGFIFWIFFYYIARFLKGSIKIKLNKKGYNAGEKISGEFKVITKKEIDGNRLFVALVGKEEIREYNNNGKQRTRTQEIYRYEDTIEDEKIYKASTEVEHSFELETPSERSKNEGVINAISKGIELFSGRRRRLKWFVEVRLDAKGIDLSSTETLRINF